MKIVMPEKKTKPFKDLEVDDFFIYENRLCVKIEDVFLADTIIERDLHGGTRGSTFNSKMFDEYGEGDLVGLAGDAEVIPVDVEIKVSYKA